VLHLVIGAALLVIIAWPVRRLDMPAWTAAVTVIGLLAYGPLLEAIAGATAGA
jgi:hypothetical protein